MQSGGASNTVRAVRTTILIVDDTPANLSLLSGILLERDYVVKVATNGARALTVATTSRPDVVMLDINMPEMDGYEVCRRLKADARTESIPVIFLSALDEVLDKVKAFQVGGVDYITKPFQVEEVIARLESQLKIARLTSALESGQRELSRQNTELRRKNDALLSSQKRTDLVFSALTEALSGAVLEERYRLDEKIGAGGFGAVYRATHLGLERPVAVKIFRPSPGNDSTAGLERFRREGVAATRLAHPNVVQTLDSGVTETGIAYLVMELLEGHTLAQELKDFGALTLARTVEVIAPVCAVLAEAASQGLVHRDIKPDNIFLHRPREGGEVVKVVDFGIAKLLVDEEPAEQHDLTMTGAVIGSPAYMSPERLLGGAYDASADVYSLGVLLYLMLSGRLPFEPRESSFTALALTYLTQDPPKLRDLMPTLPIEIEALVSSAMAKHPDTRPKAAELSLALTELSRGEVAHASAVHQRVAANFDQPTAEENDRTTARGDGASRAS